MLIKVGCCGFPVSRSKYYKTFNVVEIQQTFYDLPRIEIIKRWREEAGPQFEFTVKAWQILTHPPSSPTWRRMRTRIEPSLRDKYGFLKPTKENFEAWDKFIEVIKPLNARIIVFQTPPSFGYSKEHVANVKEFFSSINRRNYLIAWEPRGTWYEYRNELSKLLNELDLIHIVDPLRRAPARITKLLYFRLHGLGPSEVNYKYKYTDNDLKKLKDIVFEFKDQVREIYVMFNNIYMFNDAIRFKQIIEGSS